MRRRAVDGQLERQLLLGLVTSSPFLASASPVLELDLLGDTPFRQIAEWCTEYHKTYGKAPGRQIETIYTSWLSRQEEAGSEAEAIQSLLSGLSEQYQAAEELNTSYLLQELVNYLSAKKLARLRDVVDDSLLRGDATTALQEVQQFRSVQLGPQAGVDLFRDSEAWRRAFAEPLEPLLLFPGDAGRFLNHAMTRESLVGIQAPEKRGKTFLCLELAIRALQNRRRVAFFGAGDLSEAQMLLRFGVRLSGRPLRKDQCGEVRVPFEITGVQSAAQVEYRYQNCPRPVDYDSSLRAMGRFLRGCGMRAEGTPLMVSCHATQTLTVRGIEGILDGWEVERSFIPDVVIIDYADILAAPDARKQPRDQVNDIWMALRRLSQERKVLVVAPTQADARSYDASLQSMRNFSEDKRKLSHVTGLLGLNQSDGEKEQGIMRLNWIVLREAPFDQQRVLHIGQCLALGRALCCGALLRYDSPEPSDDSTGTQENEAD